MQALQVTISYVSIARNFEITSNISTIVTNRLFSSSTFLAYNIANSGKLFHSFIAGGKNE